MGNKFLLSIIVAAVITVIMYIYLKYTKHGYEIAVLGGSVQTARYAGIKVGKVIVRTVCLSGALCGVVGLLLVGSVNHTLTTTIVGGQGFTAVMVSWLAQFNPFVMVLTSLLIIFLDRGASAIATSFGVNESFSDMITGIILFFIIGCEFFIRYKVIFKKNSAEATVNTAKAEAKENSTEKIKDKATANEEKEDEE
jgi:simple sugar transport system permease protein